MSAAKRKGVFSLRPKQDVHVELQLIYNGKGERIPRETTPSPIGSVWIKEKLPKVKRREHSVLNETVLTSQASGQHQHLGVLTVGGQEGKIPT